MVIVLFVASFHALAIAVAFAQVDRVRKFDAWYWPLIRDRDVSAILLLRFFGQPLKDSRFVLLSQFLIMLLKELAHGNILGNGC